MFQNMTLRVFCHATEDEERVRKSLVFLSGDSDVSHSSMEGHFGNQIIIMEARLKGKELKRFMQGLRDSWRPLDERKLEEKVDEDCVLHLRFDKQKAYAGELAVVEHDDVIAAKVKVNVYPAKREQAVKAIKDFFGTGAGMSET